MNWDIAEARHLSSVDALVRVGDVEEEVLLVVLLVEAAHGGGGWRDHVVDEEEEGILGPQADPLANEEIELKDEKGELKTFCLK